MDYSMYLENAQLTERDREIVMRASILHEIDLEVNKAYQKYKFLKYLVENVEEKSQHLEYLFQQSYWNCFEQINRLNLLIKVLGLRSLITSNLTAIYEHRH